MDKNNILYCINLKRNNNRRNVMKTQFKNLDLNYKFCDAIDSQDIKFTENILNKSKEVRSGSYNINKNNKINFNIKSKEYYQKVNNNGHIGCTLSHLFYIKEAMDLNVDNLIMCEDDISFDFLPKWKKSINEIMENAPCDWNIIKLHCSNTRILKNYIKEEKYINIPKPSVLFWSTGFYIIKKSGMESLINRFYEKDTNTFNIHIDYPVADYLLHQIDNVYYYTIPLVKNNNSEYNFKSDVTSSDILYKEEKKGIKYVTNYYS